jgi:tetratricopeptide (TPR) repeat protein
MATLAGLLERLGAVPRLTDLTLDDDPARGLATVLRHVARGHVRAQHRPLVLVWEYVDQAPPPWSEILRYLAPELRRDLPVLLVVTATAARPPAELPAERRTAVLEVAQTLTARQEAEVRWLDRVTESEVARYLGPADPRLPRRLHHLADGIPALVESLWQQWQDATPPAVVRRHERWEIARDDDVWVFSEARDQAYALLDARLSPDASFTRAQVEEMLTLAALEGLTFTAPVVARAMALDPDDLMDCWDTFLLTGEDRPGLLEEAGFLELPAVRDETRTLNRYRFAIPYLWYVWVRDCAEAQRIACQRRVAEAVEGVYDGATALVSPLLAALFEVTGQEGRAAPYRQRAQLIASLDALRWQVTLLETFETDGQAELSDRYRLFELRADLSHRLWEEERGEEGYLQAERACAMARTWNDPAREARALNLMGLNLHAQGRYADAEPLYQRALALTERLLGPEHPHTAASLNNLAELYRSQGRYAEAEPLCQRALALRERVLGPDHPDIAASLDHLAGLYRAQGRYAAAEPLFQRALALYERAFGPNHHAAEVVRQNYLELLRATDRHAEAERLENRDQPGPTSPPRAGSS